MNAQLNLLCPTCGQPAHRRDLLKPHFVAAVSEVVFKGKSAKLQPLQLDLFALLLEAYPQPVSRARILADLYEDRDDAHTPGNKCLDVRISQMRKIFKERGVEVEIVARRGQGDRSGYALSF